MSHHNYDRARRCVAHNPAGGGAAWTPAASATALLGLEADAGAFNTGSTPATNGQTVYRWQSTLGGTKNFDQATEASKPTLVTNVINGQPVLRFDGTDDWLEWAGTLLSGVTDFALIAVLRSRGDTLGDGTRWFGNNAATDFTTYFSNLADAGKPGIRVDAGEPAAVSPNVKSGTTGAWRFTAVGDGTANTITVYEGATAGTPRSQAFDPLTGPGTGVGIGAMYGGNSFCPIDISAIFMDTDISAAQLARYAAYLQTKYGVT